MTAALMLLLGVAIGLVFGLVIRFEMELFDRSREYLDHGPEERL